MGNVPKSQQIDRYAFVAQYLEAHESGKTVDEFAEQIGITKLKLTILCSRLRSQGVWLPYLTRSAQSRGKSEQIEKLRSIVDEYNRRHGIDPRDRKNAKLKEEYEI